MMVQQSTEGELAIGYTHYTYRPEKLDKDKFIQAAVDCAKICKAINAPICHEYDDEDSPAIFSPSVIWFNGIGDDGHETFVIEQSLTLGEHDHKDEQGRYFSFCKTARKPYDTAVVACLIILHHYFGDEIVIRSDGRPKEWEEGLQAVKDYLGYGEIPNTISEK